jgi:hypothetical protein
MSRILQAAREALAIAKGEMDPSEYAVHASENTDVKQKKDIEHGNGPGEIESGQVGR